MDHHDDHSGSAVHMHMMYFCDGSIIGPGGAYQGHMLPGMLFVIWSLHMVQGSMRHWHACRRAGQPYESCAYYNWPGLPNFPWESLVKVIMSGIGATLELTWHDDGFQYLKCAPGTLRAGHFNGDHINNWQHCQMYICFMFSGLVDIIGWFGLLPRGTEKAFLSLAFAGETILMGLHAKPEALDRYLHQALAGFMLASSLGAAFETLWASSYMATCVRCAAVMLQGVMFIVIAQTRHNGYLAAWDISLGDHAPLYYAQVLVNQAIGTTIACYVGLHVLLDMLLNHTAWGARITGGKHASPTSPYNTVATIDSEQL